MVDAKKMSDVELNKKKRGTNDELEIICLILAENPALRKRVMDRMKVAKLGMAQATANSNKEKRSLFD